ETRLIRNLLGGSTPAWNLVPGDARLFHGGTGAAGAPFKYHERPSPARQPGQTGDFSSSSRSRSPHQLRVSPYLRIQARSAGMPRRSVSASIRRGGSSIGSSAKSKVPQ